LKASFKVTVTVRFASHTVRGLAAAISAGISRLPLPAHKPPAARIKMRS
jgi:hypothetical protein